MKKKLRIRKRTWKLTAVAVLGVLVVAASFGAGILMAKEKADPTAPKEWFLLPEGYTVESVYPSGSQVHIRAKDSHGYLHIFFGYPSGRGDQRIRWHSMIVPVPAAEAFDD